MDDIATATDTVERVRKALGIPASKSLCWVFLRTYKRQHDRCGREGMRRIQRDLKEFEESGKLPLYVYRCLCPEGA